MTGRDGDSPVNIYDIALRLGLLALFLYVSLRLIEPFALILLWSAILTVALSPVHGWLTGRLGLGARMAAALITLCGLVVVIGPVGALGLSLAETAGALFAALESGQISLPPAPEALKGLPLVGDRAFALWSAATSDLEAFATAHSDKILSAGGAILGKLAGVGVGVLVFAASIIVTGFLLGPADRLADIARDLGRRVSSERGVVFVEQAGATVRNVSRGVIGVALLQAILIGVGLMLAGVPAAGLLTFLILILCIIQIGPMLIVVPVLIWAWNGLEIAPALLLTVYLVGASLLDNVLKPILMARGLTTPMIVILLGVIGGSLTFGLIGLFVGPVVLGVFYDIVRSWLALDAEAR